MITSLIDIFIDIIAAMKKFCLSVFIVVAVVALPAQGKRFITEKGSAEVHLDCRSADLARRIHGGLRARDGERAGRSLRHVAVRRAVERRRGAEAADRRHPRHRAAVVARREADRIRSRQRP
jgi:hypothetical protein